MPCGATWASFFWPCLQWRRARFPEARKLYGGLALYHLIYAIGSPLPGRFSSPTGNSHGHLVRPRLDRSPALRRILGRHLAAVFGRQVRKPVVRKKSLTRYCAHQRHVCLCAARDPVSWLRQLGPGWKLIRFSLLGLSFACYALRIGLTQFRQQQDEETVRRQTLAMDTSADGIAHPERKRRSHLRQRGLRAHVRLRRTATASSASHGASSTPFRISANSKPKSAARWQQSGKWSSHLPLHRPNGTQLPVEIDHHAMPDGGTRVLCRDLSQREEAEKGARRSGSQISHARRAGQRHHLYRRNRH